MRPFQIFSLTLTAFGYLLPIFKGLEKLKIIIKQNQFYDCTAKVIYTILDLTQIADQYFFVVKIAVVRIKLQKCTQYVLAIFVELDQIKFLHRHFCFLKNSNH